MANKFVWTRPITTDLIELYQKQPGLYQVNNPAYKNKHKRNEALEEIRIELIERNKDAAKQCLTTDDIKNKIHGLRTQYFKELGKFKRMQSSEGAMEELEAPKLWCFPLLDFLRTTTSVKDHATNIEENHMPGDDLQTENIFEDSVDEFKSESIFLPELLCKEHGPSGSGTSKRSYVSSPEESRTPTPVIYWSKRKEDRGAEMEKLMEAASGRLQESRHKNQRLDDLDAFGLCVIQEMRLIKDPTRRRKLKRTIFSAVMDAQDEEDSS